MKINPTWQANNLSVSQVFRRLALKQKANYHFYNIITFYPILWEFN
jgi:hypothetical protein